MGISQLTRIVSWLLIGLGVGSYIGTGADSPTALIPVVLGIGLALTAKLADDLGWVPRLLWSGLALATLGLAGSLRVLPDLTAFIAGEAIEYPAAMTVQTITIVLSAVLIGWYGRVMLDSRRERVTQGAQTRSGNRFQDGMPA